MNYNFPCGKYLECKTCNSFVDNMCVANKCYKEDSSFIDKSKLIGWEI